MTLKSALTAINKNRNLLLKRGDQYYHYDNHYNVPYTANVYPRSQNDTNHGDGFAWADSQHSHALSVGYKELTATNWEIVDGEDIVVLSGTPSNELMNYVEKFDDNNKYHPDKSEYGQHLIKEGNKLLQEIGSPCELVFSNTPYHYFSLNSPPNTDLNWLFKSTKALCKLAKRLIEEENTKALRKLFEENRPDGTIVVKKVNMAEFLDRIQKSKKLWLADVTNSWKKSRNKTFAKDWDKCLLDPVALKRCNYSGARTDRIATRNAFTNKIGLPECRGSVFYSLDDKSGYSGTYFADVVKNYGCSGDSIIVDNNEMLVLVHEAELPEPHAEHSYLQSITSPPSIKTTSHGKICKILNQRLANFESYAK